MLDFIYLSGPELGNYIRTIGYPLMLLLMIIEGPIATILAAFSASLGFFNVYAVLALSIMGDLLGDIILYSIGATGGSKVLQKAERILKINPDTVKKIECLFKKHGKKTVFAVKSTTGLCWITFIAAGTVKMKLKDFLTASFLGGIVWSSFLVVSGYFFGYAFIQIDQYLQYAGIIIFASVILFYVLVTLYKNRKSRQILDNNTPENA